jgi:RNA polymerase-binding transcription factor
VVAEPERARVAIAAARAETVRLIEALGGRWQMIVDASALATDDDEHDPEGATIAFERAQVGATLATAHAELADLDAAVERVAAGTYWTCVVCGGPIAEDRLEARPAARNCITCARAADR